MKSEIRQDFRTAYEFLESHYPPNDTKEYWTDLLKEINKVWNDKSKVFLSKLYEAVFYALEQEVKEAQK